MEKKYKKLLSIILPIYNIGGKINGIIESFNDIDDVLFKDIEIIFVNDGSKYNEFEIVKKKLKKKYIWLNKKNEGTSLARKYGINNSSGMYIWFIDPDDIIITNELHQLIKLISLEQYDIFLFGMTENYISKNKKVDIKYFKTNKSFTNFQKNKIHTLLKEGLRTCSLCNKIIKASLLINNNLDFNFANYHEDTVIWFELMPHIKSLYYYDKVIYQYQIYGGDSGNAMNYLNKNRIQSIKFMCDAIKIILNYYNNLGIIFSNRIIKILNHYIISDLYTTKIKYHELYREHKHLIKKILNANKEYKKAIPLVRFKYFFYYYLYDKMNKND